MATCAITATIRNAAGAAIPAATLTLTPSNPDRLRAQDGSVILANPVTVVANGAGVISVSLLTGDYSYTAATPLGPVAGKLRVPDRVSATLDAILATPDTLYEVMTWAAFQALVAATPAPYGSVSAALTAVANGALFMAISDDTIIAGRKVGGGVTFVFPEVV